MSKYYKFEFKMIIMNIVSILLGVICFAILFASGYSIEINNYLLFYIGILLYLILHELLHGIGYSLFAKDKKNIKYGIMLEKGIFYAMCQEKINKTAIITSLLFPLIFLSIITFPISIIYHIDWLIILSIFNFSGASGDILATILLLKAPKDVCYIDYDNVIGAYLISKQDMSKLKSFGFKLTETGLEKDMKIDKSIKRFYVSIPSIIYLLLFILTGIIASIL